MLQLLFFGDLAKKVLAPDGKQSSPTILHVEQGSLKRVRDILERYGIDQSETSHIFINGVYSGFSKIINDGDRIGIFPKNMALLYKWYFTRAEDDEQEHD